VRHAGFGSHRVAAILIGVVATAAARADTPAPPPEVPPIADVLDASGIVVTGFMDATYEYLSTSGEFKGGTPSRVFDFQENTFTVHQAAATVAMQPKEGFGALVDVTAGVDADVIKAYPIKGGGDIDLTQAFLQYSDGPFTIVAGKFVTLAGAEVIAETLDTNSSRSILFGYAEPFTHTGLRMIDAVSDQFSVTLGVNNGWDQITDANNDKTIEVALGWTPSKAFSVLVDGYAGQEPILITARDINTERELLDVVVTWSATDTVTLIANYDWGRQTGAAGDGGSARWSGVAGYVNYQFSDHWRGSLRAEWFDDPQGYRTGVDQPRTEFTAAPAGQVWTEATLTVGYAPTKHVEVRIEARADKSNAPDAFVSTTDARTGAGELTDKQESLALQGLFRF
jgi:hypothetical protein